MSASYEDIEFQSAAATLRGRLHKATKPDAPLVVLAHGFSATAHMSINAYCYQGSDGVPAVSIARGSRDALGLRELGWPLPDHSLRGCVDGDALLGLRCPTMQPGLPHCSRPAAIAE